MSYIFTRRQRGNTGAGLAAMLALAVISYPTMAANYEQTSFDDGDVSGTGAAAATIDRPDEKALLTRLQVAF